LQISPQEVLYRLSDTASKVLIDVNARRRERLEGIGAYVSRDQSSHAQPGHGLSSLYPCAARRSCTGVGHRLCSHTFSFNHDEKGAATESGINCCVQSCCHGSYAYLHGTPLL